MDAAVLDDIHGCAKRRGQPIGGQRLSNRAMADDALLPEHDEAIGRECQRKIVDGAHHADTAAVGLLAQEARDILLMRRIEVGRWLVEQ
jgi:hypothetical protein